jgi:ornithine cyclodeaminase
MNFKFSVINGTTVNKVINQNFQNIYDSIKEAYLLHDVGQTVNPNSYFLKFPQKPNARIIALPAYLGGKYNVSGIKWIGSYPDNVKKQFPRASAVLILNDYDTGYPFVCIEASIISAMRTALSAVLAAEYINKRVKKVKSVGFVGNGIIAKYIAKSFYKNGWEFVNTFLYDKNQDESKKFGKYINKEYCREVIISRSLEHLIKNCNLTIFATTAPVPYFSDFELLKHNPILLNISLRDLSPEILLLSNNIVDDIDHVLNANTAPHLVYQKTNNKDFINGTIADLINNEINLDEDKPTIFSPMGMGTLDLALGKTIYEYAIKNNLVTNIENFFYELER